MKIGGVQVTAPVEEFIVLPRGDGDDIVVKAKALPDMEEFDVLCPPPKPPGRRTKHGWEPNEDDETYRTQVIRREEQRVAYLTIMALEPSDIEWETVVIDDPKTWRNWRKDMKEAGLTGVEVNRIQGLVFEANSLDEEKLKRARESFLAGQQKNEDEHSSPHSEQASTPSGQPATE